MTVQKKTIYLARIKIGDVYVTFSFVNKRKWIEVCSSIFSFSNLYNIAFYDYNDESHPVFIYSGDDGYEIVKMLTADDAIFENTSEEELTCIFSSYDIPESKLLNILDNRKQTPKMFVTSINQEVFNNDSEVHCVMRLKKNRLCMSVAANDKQKCIIFINKLKSILNAG